MSTYSSITVQSGIPQNLESLQALWKLLKIMLESLEFDDVVARIVNSILDELGYMKLGYRIIVLSLVDKNANGLRRIALSQTPEAARAVAASTIPFEKIVIPFTASDNLGIKCLVDGRPYVTKYWPDLLTPPLTPEAALTNQRAAGIKTSMVYPVIVQNKPIGTLIFSMVKEYEEVTEEEKELLRGFTDLVGYTVQNSMLYTQFHDTSKQLAQANQRLKELDKLKDDFVSVASHELRTPMTVIKSYLWMALNRSDVKLSDKMKKYIDRAYVSTERLINLVNDMLNVSRIESGRIEIRPSVFSLQALMEETISEITPKADEKAIKIFIAKSPLPEVFADSDKVHQVLLNLFGNALKFTPSQGSIIASFSSDGQMVEASIKDSGVGISKEDISRLFQKFGRLDNSYVAAATSGGTGLGLFICKSLVELMKGKIWVESEGVGKGTKFTFSLPVATQKIIREAKNYTQKPSGEVKHLEPVAI